MTKKFRALGPESRAAVSDLYGFFLPQWTVPLVPVIGVSTALAADLRGRLERVKLALLREKPDVAWEEARDPRSEFLTLIDSNLKRLYRAQWQADRRSAPRQAADVRIMLKKPGRLLSLVGTFLDRYKTAEEFREWLHILGDQVKGEPRQAWLGYVAFLEAKADESGDCLAGLDYTHRQVHSWLKAERNITESWDAWKKNFQRAQTSLNEQSEALS